MNLSKSTLIPLSAALFCGSALLGAAVVSASPAPAGVAAEGFGTPHGVVKGRAKVVSYTTRFHGEPSASPLYRVDGKFSLEDFPYPTQGHQASVFFLRKGHYASHASLRALDKGDPNLGQIELKRIPQRSGALVGVLAKITRGSTHGIVSYEAGRVRIRSQKGDYTLELPTAEDGSFQAPLPPGIYELSSLDHFSKPKWIRVRAQRSSLAVLEVSEARPEPEEVPGADPQGPRGE